MRALSYAPLVGLLAVVLNSQTFCPALRGRGVGEPMSLRDTTHAAADFRWEKQLAPGATVEVKGLRGNITAEPAAGDRVEVVAAKRGPRGEAEAVEVRAVEHGGGVTVCAVYPTIDPRQPYVCRPGDESQNYGMVFFRHNDVEVNFTVRVPRGVRFVGRTVLGEVRATSLGGDVEAFTVNGDVRLDTAGHVRAVSMTGSIVASLKQAALARPLELRTVNGDITVALPAGANANLLAETSYGRITTDFPLDVRRGPAQRSAAGAVGRGGSDVMLKTVFGSIRVRRAP